MLETILISLAGSAVKGAAKAMFETPPRKTAGERIAEFFGITAIITTISAATGYGIYLIFNGGFLWTTVIGTIIGLIIGALTAMSDE